MESNSIIIFARHPTPGKVKTRLAAGIGDDAAAEFYKQCAEWVINQCIKASIARCSVHYSVPEEGHQVENWLSKYANDLTFQSQLQPEDLGERLAHAVALAHITGFQHVLIVGTDVPSLTQNILQSAINFLETHDVVFGPAEDGGYYLVGLSLATTAPSATKLFSNILWSTEVVLEQNIANAQALGLSVAPIDSLPKLLDVDTIEDLVRWQRHADAAHPLALAAQQALSHLIE